MKEGGFESIFEIICWIELALKHAHIARHSLF